MVIVIQPIRSTYRMYFRNKFVHFDLLLNFILQEVDMETKRPVIIRFQTNRYQYRQQQKSISDFDIYRYRYNNNNNNKRRSGSLFCLRERRLAHFVGINIIGEMGADYQQQQQQRKQKKQIKNQIRNWKQKINQLPY